MRLVQKFRDVVGDAGNGFLAHGLGAEKRADVIRHFDQVVRAAVAIGGCL